MIKVDIIKNNEITNSGTFQNQEEADAWITREVANNSWGKSDRWVSFIGEPDPGYEDTREVDEKTEYFYPSEYEIQQTDLGNAPLQEAKLNQIRSLRAPKLARVDQLINVAYLNSWTSTEKTELRNYRKNLLEITDEYKEDPSLLDNLDVSQIVWPTEPTEV